MKSESEQNDNHQQGNMIKVQFTAQRVEKIAATVTKFCIHLYA